MNIEKRKNRPGIHYPPPLIYAAVFFIAMIVQNYIPISQTFLETTPVQVAARVFIFISPFIALTALIQFIRTKNPLTPFKKTKSLQTTGVYSFTRNPMYLGLLSLYTGLSLMFVNWWSIIFIPLLIIFINLLVIKKEETKLERTFGQTYLDYKEKVRRWI